MIKVKPELEEAVACPGCGCRESRVEAFSMAGVFATVDVACPGCSKSFRVALPIGHAVDLTLAQDKATQSVIAESEHSLGPITWLPKVFEAFCANRKEQEVAISKKVYQSHSRVVILNTLDSIYGHCVLKLYNAQHHLDKDSSLGLVVIVPKVLEWMVPKGCAEAWVVDIGLGALRSSYAAIERFVNEECSRFQEVFLSRAYSHPDFSTVDISRFTGIVPFDLNDFDRGNPCFTFVLRGDRVWFANGLAESVYWLFMKLKLLNWVRGIYSGWQDALVRRAIKRIKREYPSAEFWITGFGKARGFSGLANDARRESADAEVERHWCGIFARSHVVIGVHGSNMLLPTAMAAACVEILPAFRLYNIGQDLSIRYADRRQIFMYRIVPQGVHPAELARQAISIKKHYVGFYRNMVVNVYR
jgi:hypothetical protein